MLKCSNLPLLKPTVAKKNHVKYFNEYRLIRIIGLNLKVFLHMMFHAKIYMEREDKYR